MSLKGFYSTSKSAQVFCKLFDFYPTFTHTHRCMFGRRPWVCDHLCRRTWKIRVCWCKCAHSHDRLSRIGPTQPLPWM